MRRCSECKKNKEDDEFHRRKKGSALRVTQCKVCVARKSKDWYINNKSRSRANRQRYSIEKYGISLKQYQAMVAFQDNLCRICRQGPSDGDRLYIDHNHMFDVGDPSGIRGLLCQKCNSGLGMVNDSIETLEGVRDYLLSFASQMSACPQPQLN